ncbi:MAG: hypoxanthine phosphoribosyltransferase [Flavobacteriales bacterium]|nr:MAG: hypoxanthine phosphoribosyltransferase [Flavobacteriales bacterium]
MKTVQVKDKQFSISISSQEIQKAIEQIAGKINSDLDGRQPLFLCVLNGAFMFASDLLKKITIDCELSFVKLASYEGTESTGVVKSLIGLDENVKGRTVIIVEDIVDTGETIDTLVKQLEVFEPEQVKIATLLFKPEAYQKDIPIDYVALEVPPDFLVGYGLDYDGLGRNLQDIYTLTPNE